SMGIDGSPAAGLGSELWGTLILVPGSGIARNPGLYRNTRPAGLSHAGRLRPRRPGDKISCVSLPRFFVEALAGPRVQLLPEEARHAARARRLRVGQRVSLFDAAGREALGTIVQIAPTGGGRVGVEVQIDEVAAAVESGGLQLTLAVAVPKGPRAEWLIEKA